MARSVDNCYTLHSSHRQDSKFKPAISLSQVQYHTTMSSRQTLAINCW